MTMAACTLTARLTCLSTSSTASHRAAHRGATRGPAPRRFEGAHRASRFSSSSSSSSSRLRAANDGDDDGYYESWAKYPDDQGVPPEIAEMLREVGDGEPDMWKTKPPWCQPWTILLTFRRGQPKIATASLTKQGVSHSGTRFHEDFAKFTRPHTILGTIISVSSVTMMAMQFGGVLEMSGALLFSKQTAQALVSAVLMNVAIVGINQVYDKKLDRVNKPYLPLASGAFSSDTALSIIAACTTLSLALGALSGSSALLFSLVVSLLLGIVYSVDYPGLRWKRSPVLAASCVLFVRAAIVQIGFFAHALGRGLLDFHLPKNLWFAIGFMAVYGVVIALFKDLPDVVGDKKHGFRTLGVRLGPSVVFNICVSLLAMAYGCAVILSVMYHSTTSTVLGVLHAAVIIPLLIASKRVDVSSSASLYGFYEKHIWRSFYLQYFLLPFCAFC